VRYDRRGRIAQGPGKCVDIGARQRCGRDRDVMIGKPARLGDAPRLGSRKLSLIFAIWTVVDNRAHSRTGERLNIWAIEPAGDAQSGRQGNKLRCHAAPPGYLRARSFAALDPAVT
jgi:hypothetical protein